MSIILPAYFKDLPEFVSIDVASNTFVEYKRYEESLRNRVSLTQNMLIYVVSGQKVIRTHQEDLIINAGEAAIVRKGLYIMSSKLGTEQPYESLLFFLQEPLIHQFIQDHAAAIRLTNSQTTSPPDFFKIPTSDLLKSYLDSIIPYFKYAHAATEMREQAMKLKFQELLLNILLFDTNRQFRAFLAAIDQDKNLDLKAIMEANYHRNLTLPEFAFLTGRSLASFKRAFQAAFNTSPAKWLKEKRLTQAYILLQQSELNVNEISEQVGFESPSHFIQSFKIRYGLTPKKMQFEPVTI